MQSLAVKEKSIKNQQRLKTAVPGEVDLEQILRIILGSISCLSYSIHQAALD